jgi:hypothetical protein
MPPKTTTTAPADDANAKDWDAELAAEMAHAVPSVAVNPPDQNVPADLAAPIAAPIAGASPDMMAAIAQLVAQTVAGVLAAQPGSQHGAKPQGAHYHESAAETERRLAEEAKNLPPAVDTRAEIVVRLEQRHVDWLRAVAQAVPVRDTNNRPRPMTVEEAAAYVIRHAWLADPARVWNTMPQAQGQAAGSGPRG